MTLDASDTSSTLTSSNSDEFHEHNIWNPMLGLLDGLDFGRIALSCRFALDVPCDKAEVHCLADHAIQRRCFVRESPLALTRCTDPLDHGLSAQVLLGTRVRGELAIDRWPRTQYDARHFNCTPSGTIVIKAVVQIGTIAAIAFPLPSDISCGSVAARGGSPSRWAQSPAGHSTWTPHFSLVLMVTSDFGPRSHQANGSHE